MFLKPFKLNNSWFIGRNSMSHYWLMTLNLNPLQSQPQLWYLSDLKLSWCLIRFTLKPFFFFLKATDAGWNLIFVWGCIGFQEFLWKGACSLPHTPTLFWPSCGIKAFWHPIHQEQELRYEFHVQSSSWSVGRAEKHNRLWRESIEWSRSYRIQFAPSDQISVSKIEVKCPSFC